MDFYILNILKKVLLDKLNKYLKIKNKYLKIKNKYLKIKNKYLKIKKISI